MLIDECARALADGKALGWHQGRMEFGPRALGGRSILGDPRSPAMQRTLNLKVKYRESFRPFAPSVLREDVSEWFDIDDDSPYMLLVADVPRPPSNSDDRGAESTLRDRQAQCATFVDSRGNARGLFRTYSDSPRRHESALLPVTQAFQRADRLLRCRQYKLQCSR